MALNDRVFNDSLSTVVKWIESRRCCNYHDNSEVIEAGWLSGRACHSHLAGTEFELGAAQSAHIGNQVQAMGCEAI
jgi:hypothetical protein